MCKGYTTIKFNNYAFSWKTTYDKFTYLTVVYLKTTHLNLQTPGYQVAKFFATMIKTKPSKQQKAIQISERGIISSSNGSNVFDTIFYFMTCIFSVFQHIDIDSMFKSVNRDVTKIRYFTFCLVM